jgi:predicted HicB family RNase H-like nuclease
MDTRQEAEMTEFAQQTVEAGKKQEAYRVAAEMYRQDPDWVTFFREVLGVDGVVRRLFPSSEEMAAFEQADEYCQIQQMVARLRQRTKSQEEGKEPTRVITVRLPQSLHESLKAEAFTRQTSINQLCISKLLQVVSDDLVPPG